MPSDFESGTRKTIALTVQTEKLTSDILKTAMQEFLSGRAEKKGKMVSMRIQPFISIARTKSLWTEGKLSFSSSSTMAKC